MFSSCPRTLLALCMALSGATSLAQTPPLAPSLAPNMPGVADPIQEQRRAQDREQAQQQRMLQEQQGRQTQTEAAAAQAQARKTSPYALLPKDESPCFRIQQVVFAGVNQQPVSSVLLRGLDGAIAVAQDPQSHAFLADSPMGRCLGAQGINTVLERAQNHVIARGYVTSRVLAPAQDLKTGTLTLTVVPGYVASIRTDPSVAPEQAAKAGLFTGIPTGAGRLLSLRDIEQGLENLKRVPTADADIKIAPAQTAPNTDQTPTQPFGQSDLIVSYQQNRPVRLSLSVDDSGSDSTGTYQGSATLSLDNTFGLNELFYVAYNHDLGGGAPSVTGRRGTQGHTFYYSMPFGYWSVAGTWSANDYRQTVAGATQNYVYSGTSKNMEIFLSRVLYRDAQRKTTATVKLWGRSSRNFIDDTEIEVQRRRVGGWAAQINHREYLGKSTVDLNLSYKRGTGAWKSEPAPEEAFGEGTSRFGLITADATWNMPFRMGQHNLRVNTHWRLQHALSPLTPQDRFAIGGRYTVRGFDGDMSLSAERGLLVRNELGWALGQTGQELYLGLDYGHVSGPSSQYLIGKQLAGSVLGLRGSGWAWAKGLSYDIFVGTPVYKPRGFRTAGKTAGFGLNWAF